MQYILYIYLLAISQMQIYFLLKWSQLHCGEIRLKKRFIYLSDTYTDSI